MECVTVWWPFFTLNPMKLINYAFHCPRALSPSFSMSFFSVLFFCVLSIFNIFFLNILFNIFPVFYQYLSSIFFQFLFSLYSITHLLLAKLWFISSQSARNATQIPDARCIASTLMDMSMSVGIESEPFTRKRASNRTIYIIN